MRSGRSGYELAGSRLPARGFRDPAPTSSSPSPFPVAPVFTVESVVSLRRPAPYPHFGSRRFVVPGCRCCRRAGAGPVLPLGTPRPFPQRGWNLINSRAMKLNGGGLRDRRFGSRRGETRPRAGGLPALPPGAPGVGRHCRGTARAFGYHC